MKNFIGDDNLSDRINYVGKVAVDVSACDFTKNFEATPIEWEFLNYVRAGADMEQVIRSDYRGEVIENFSHFRHYLTEWLPFRGNENILEVGCGCGALTGCLLNMSTRGGQLTLWKILRSEQRFARRGSKMTNG